MFKKNWKREISQLAMDWYRHGWNSPLTLEEAFKHTARAHRGEATYGEMAAWFKSELKTWKAFYADTETVSALMAYSH